MAALQIDPELRIHAEEESERVGNFGLDGTPALDNLVDRRTRDSRAPGKLGLGHSISLEEFLFKDAAGRGGKDGFLFRGHWDWRVSGNR